MHDRWSRLDAVLNGCDGFHRHPRRYCLLFGFLFVGDAGKDRVSRPIPAVGDALPARLLGQPLVRLYLVLLLVVARVDRFPAAALGFALVYGLQPYALFP